MKSPEVPKESNNRELKPKKDYVSNYFSDSHRSVSKQNNYAAKNEEKYLSPKKDKMPPIKKGY